MSQQENSKTSRSRYGSVRSGNGPCDITFEVVGRISQTRPTYRSIFWFRKVLWMIRYMFRSPKYPLIIDIDGHVVAARSGQGLEKKLSSMELSPGRIYDAVDSTGQTWSLLWDSRFLSPLTGKKRPTKLQLVKLVNGRKNRSKDEKRYSEKSLSAKTLEKVFDDLVKITE